MVRIVVIPNTDVTNIKPGTLFVAAGYIKIGIRASQGPKMKIVKSTQGVILFFSSLWG